MQGIHLIADLYGCDCPSTLLLDRATLERLCESTCRNAGLTPLGTYFYQFEQESGEKAGVTGTVVLAESHLAIHTWPESRSATLDVYVCNFSRDNSDRARTVFHTITARLQPQEQIDREVTRGELQVIATGDL
jgi:S-adenosylmethionine decarboxylase proenzyme